MSKRFAGKVALVTGGERGIGTAIVWARFGRPEEIAAGAVFFASPEASFLTGAVLDIDGGFAA